MIGDFLCQQQFWQCNAAESHAVVQQFLGGIYFCGVWSVQPESSGRIGGLMSLLSESADEAVQTVWAPLCLGRGQHKEGGKQKLILSTSSPFPWADKVFDMLMCCFQTSVDAKKACLWIVSLMKIKKLAFLTCGIRPAFILIMWGLRRS